MKRFFVLICVTAFLFGITGCTNVKEDKVILGTDLVKYNVRGVSDFGFNINLVSNKEDVDIKFVSFSGVNVQGLSVTLADDTYEDLATMEHNGYYIRLLGFVCHTGDDLVEINGVTLLVDGVEKYYEFCCPIKHYVNTSEFESQVQIMNYPLFISTNSYESTEYTFEYLADENISFLGFTFSDFLTPKNAMVIVDDVEIGSLDEVLPLEISKGSIVKIKCKLGFVDGIIATDYDSVYCDSKFAYTDEKNDVIKVLTNTLVSQSVSNIEDAYAAITLLAN